MQLFYKQATDIVVGGEESETILTGVPQDSVLGLLLFKSIAIIIDGVARIPLFDFWNKVASALYADDMLYRRISCPEDLTSIDIVNNWVNGNNLCFNTIKYIIDYM